MRIDNVAVVATRLWVERVVIGLSLCPWAGPAAVTTRYAHVATHDAGGVAAAVLAEMDLLARSPPSELETTVLVAPEFCADDFGGFNAFRADMDALLLSEGLDSDFQIVGFHPDHRFAGESADEAGNYANRAPHPALQLLRQPSVTAAVDGHRSSLAVPEDNARRLRALGGSALAEMLRRVRHDAARIAEGPSQSGHALAHSDDKAGMERRARTRQVVALAAESDGGYQYVMRAADLADRRDALGICAVREPTTLVAEEGSVGFLGRRVELPPEEAYVGGR